MRGNYLFLLLITLYAHALDKITYTFSDDPIDVVIPCHPKDKDIISFAIDGARKNVVNIRNIFIISEFEITKEAIWIPENIFPFTKFSISYEIFNDEEKAKNYIYADGSRIGWIYQQFLKLYCLRTIPNISSNVLILDADTIFLQPTNFIDQNGAGLFNVHKQHYQPYFDFINRLLGIDKKFEELSGITNHMIFQRCVINDLFDIVENKHKTDFWRALCYCIDKKRLINDSCMSEYELYFNFSIHRSNQFKTRALDFCESMTLREFKLWIYPNKYGLFSALDLDDNTYTYVSCHFRKLNTFLS